MPEGRFRSCGQPGEAMDEERPPFRYDARLAGQIERRWQERWEREGTFQAANPSGALSDGCGAEAGRPKFYLRMTGQHPAATVRQNAAVMRRQLRRLAWP